MRIFFIGTVEFSKSALIKLVKIGANIIGVATKESSPYNSDFADLTEICISNQIPFKYVKDINEKKNVEWIESLHPDIIFCFGWSQLIKKELLNLTKFGILGYHPAKLPANRGRHPLIWALVLGLKETASTFFFMDEVADSGDILSQKEITIHYEDDASSLYQKMTQTALEQIEEFLPKLVDNNFVRIQQNHSLANNWRKRNEKDCQIDFRMSSRAIYNLIRGLTRPYIAAHLIYKGQKIKIWKAKEIENNNDNIEPGKVLNVENNCVTIKCMKNDICFTEHEFIELPIAGEYLYNE